MSEIFNIEKTCSFTGHRILKSDFNIENLENTIKKAILLKYETFLVGMAYGFDLIVCETLLKLKEIYPIKIVACLPCKEQDKYYKQIDKYRYKQCLQNVNKIVYICENYVVGCMQQRNRYMVDNSSLLISYMYEKVGGTYYTTKYAEKKKKEIIYL